jgi:integrase
MARRRFQDPKPFRRGAWWCLLTWQDRIVEGKPERKRKWHRLAPARMSEREVRKIAAELLRPLNQGLESIGSATTFQNYVDNEYKPLMVPLMAKATQERYKGVLKNHLLPAFGGLCLRDLTARTVQRYFTGLAESKLSFESVDKIRDVLASVMNTAIEHGFLVQSPLSRVKLPRDRRGRKSKPFLTPQQFALVIDLIAEPYATMVYAAVYTGLRVSELCGLRWRSLHTDSITIDERYCRGDFGAPKSEASNATIPVNQCVLDRIAWLKTLTVEVRSGRAVRKYRVVKRAEADDLVFQSVRTGAPMRDNNILCRYIKPVGRKLGMPWLNWRCLRTSHATWLKLAGADVKDAQAQMRHSRASTTLDIYQQFVPESQQRVVARLSSLSPVVN